VSDEYPIEILNADSSTLLLTGNLCFSDPDKIPGARWYDGGGPPTDNYGVDGDYYLDNDTGAVYRKDGGTWQ
jgi:hypothetical protein